MCLALPAQIVEIDEITDSAIASLGGVKKEISLALVEDARVGDYVLIHVGYALNKVSEEEAEKNAGAVCRGRPHTGGGWVKYIDEFRSGELATKLASAIGAEAESGRDYNLMEFCGGHTHAIFRYGVQDLMPDNVNFIHGPGCPVCVASHRTYR